MKVRHLSIALLAILTDCNPGNHTLLQGTWKIDSVYSYYNGFGFTRHEVEEEPLLHYKPEGNLTMTRGNETRSFFYEIPNGDTLIHRKSDKGILEKFIIVKLDKDRLILKREMRPVFGGINQERMELRYFSRVSH